MSYAVRQRLAAAVAAGVAVIALLGSVVVAAPALADPFTAVLDLGKSVDKTAVSPGQTFTYTLTPSCSSGDCLDATVVDTVPAEFDALTLNPTVVITGSPATYSWGGTNNRTLTVNFTTPAAGGGVELPSGDGPSIQFSLTVPGGLSPDWASNGVPVTNTADITASDAAPKSATATTTITIPYNNGVATTASWSPSSTQFKVGELSNLTVGVRNTSNGLATNLTAALPTDPTAASNLFDTVDLSGLGAVVFPAGADQIQVDAYVAGAWVTGAPSATAALPSGVVPGTVTGLRFIFTSSSGATITAGGSAGSVVVILAQRSATRTSGTNLVTGATATAAVTGTVSLGTHGTASSSASASYVIGGLTSVVSGTTSFTPNRIPAGTSSVVSLSGTNTSNGPLASLTLTEPSTGSLFGGSVSFAGFTGTAVWPSGATSATISWFVDSGTAPASTTISSTDPFPATPSLTAGQNITGFSVEYDGAIAAGTTATAPFRVAVAADAVADSSSTLTVTNTARIDGHNDAGDATPATPSGTLLVFYPQIAVAAGKTITPSAAVPAGGRSIVQLTAKTNSDTAYVSPTEIVVTDQADPANPDYWDAFDAVAVAPTQVPAGATLLVSTTTDGSTWTQVGTVTAGASAVVYQTALTDTANLIGIRFDFTNAAGFAQSTTLPANVSFVARSTLRDTGLPPSAVGSSTSYPNSVTVTSTGDVLVGGSPVSATSTAGANASVTTLPDGSSGLLLSKAWQLVSGSATVNSQSGQQRTATVSWGTQISGYSGAVVQEPATPDTTGGTSVFQTFDLYSISAITPTTDPYMAFDQVTKVELFNGTTWTAVGTCTALPTNPCQGSFPGYTLTSGQRASTIGVRITFAPDDALRTTDPLAPPQGSGITSGPNTRPVKFVFGIRNKVRDTSVMSDPSNPWVTGQRVYNNTDPGSVLNTAAVSMTPASGPDVSASASDAIQILDNPPAVSLAKTTANTKLSIPVAGDVAPSGYPTNRFTLTTSNASAAKAWYLRVTDQMPCATTSISDCAHTGGAAGAAVNPYASAVYDPSTNPFEDVTITKISYSSLTNTGIDAASSTVTLWHSDGTTTQVALNSATLSSAAALADVVGVSALYTGTGTTNGGTINQGASVSLYIDTQLRKFQRSQPTVLVAPVTLTNSAFAESWDGVLDDSSAYAAKSVTVTLNNAALAVATTKTFSSPTILEKDRSNDVTVTLHADSSTATASPKTLTIADTTAGFWNTFELRALPSFTLPAGAATVEVDVQLNGSSSWTLGTAAATPALPAGVTAAQVTGIQFVFTGSAANNGLFSTAAPAAAWTVNVPMTVRVRAALLDTGAAVAFPSTVTDDVVATAAQDNLTPKTATNTASVSLATGTFTVDISKTPDTATSPAGQVDNFTLIMTNTGTGYLNNPVVVDTLPSDGSLVWDPTSEITYTDSSGGILPVVGQTVAYDAGAGTITISWPSGSRLAPGEKYTMVLPIQLQAGLQSSHGPAVNQFTFSSDRTLASCTNTASGNGQSVSRSGTTCTTQNSVSTISASAISSFKGVKGNVDASGVSTSGAVNINNAATPCVADSDGYYRNPCAAYSVIGGTDLWKVQVTNGGNVPATSASVVDVLPTPGDVYLRSGSSRGSSYRPVFAGGVALITDTASAVSSYVWQVSTAANPCPSYGTDPNCTGAGWVDGSTFSSSNYASVTAVRIVFTFVGGTLPPAATIAMNYKTVNAPSLTSSDKLAPTTVPVSSARAWNSFGVYATFGSGYADRTVEPIRAGVQLATGPIQVTKAITGAAATYAPTSFTATVSCAVAGAPITMPSGGVVTLAATNATPYVARIDGIPLGADCRIVESSASASTASSVAYSPLASAAPDAAEVTVGLAAASTDPVPAAQQATITNSYGTTQLTIIKKVSTTATIGTFGPFAFGLACTVNNGTSTLTVPLAAGDASFSLAVDGTKTVTGLPVTARCALTETDSDGATSIGVAVDGGSSTATTQGAPVTIVLGTNAGYSAVVTNRYDGGTLAVSKTVAGSGAGLYGSGPFAVSVDCTYHGQDLYTGSSPIAAGQTVNFDPVFPIGTQCAVHETDAGGATTAAADTSVTIPGPTGVQTVGLVTAGLTNTFTTGTFEVDKAFAGAGAAEYGAGPFTAQVSCTWTKNGTVLTIPLPGSGIVTLDAAHGYTASVTGLIAGASCSAVETATGGATSTDVGTASPALVPADGTSIQTITNHYDTGSLTITKEQTGEGRATYGDGTYTAAVSCFFLSNGAQVPIDLGSDATITLSPGNYVQTISGLLVGASCTVTETDAGLAVSSVTDPVDGTVIIPAAVDGPAAVTITNTFLLGSLSIDKSASATIVQGDSDFEYTFDVRNTGHVDAAGVTVVDVLDPSLKATSLDAPGWTACAVTGADVDGYGGTLNCVLDTTLAVGGIAPLITLGVHVLPTITQDDLVNRADVTSTTPVVTGDHDTVVTPVKWLDANVTPLCLKDAPYLDYSVDARNVDLTGKSMTVEWLDAANTVIHTDTVVIDGPGLITGRLLWPGATVAADGTGTGWPGWRAAGPGETPTWENLLLDPTLPTYGLRSGAKVRLSINPTTTLDIDYPPATASCAEASGDPQSGLWITKRANSSHVNPGGSFTYTIESGNTGLGGVTDFAMVDPVPNSLKILSVDPAAPSDADSPAWTSCVVTDRLASGYGGTVTCLLDRPLGALGSVPAVNLTVMLNPRAGLGTVMNTAHVSGIELGDLRTLADPEDSASISSSGRLALTGIESAGVMFGGLALLLLGIAVSIAAIVLRRRSDGRPTEH